MQGWVKIHRKLAEKGYYKKSQYVHLWVHLIISANHKDKEFMFNGSITLVKRGQLLTGRKQLSEDTGIPETTIERILNLFENEHQIRQQKTNRNRLITVINYNLHQIADIKADNKRTTSGQQADTNKNDKNVERMGSVGKAPAHSFSLTGFIKDVLDEIPPLYSSFDLRFYYEKVKLYGQTSGKPIIDFNATAKRFMLDDLQGEREVKSGVHKNISMLDENDQDVYKLKFTNGNHN